MRIIHNTNQPDLAPRKKGKQEQKKGILKYFQGGARNLDNNNLFKKPTQNEDHPQEELAKFGYK